jgi:transposase
MNTSLLYHDFGLRNQEFIKIEYKYGKTAVKVQTKKDKLNCPECKGYNIIKRGVKERMFRTLPIGKKEVWLFMDIQRIECKDCGTIRQEHLDFAQKKKVIPMHIAAM